MTGPAINVFKQTHQLLVEVPLSTNTTTTGPFVNLANVRLTAVRVYVRGAKTTNGDLKLTVIHTGKEKIVNSSNKVFSFQHNAIPKAFHYVIPKSDSDPIDILVDGTFNITASGETDLLALVGPFTFWHVVLDPAKNPGLDLSQVTSIEFEFRGYAQGYGVGR